MDPATVSKPLLVHTSSGSSHNRSGSATGVKYLSSSVEASAVGGGGVSGGVQDSSSRSLSMNSVSSEGSLDTHLVEQEEILALTHDIRGFKEALGRLRKIFQAERDKKREVVRVSAHERLGEVLRILRTILERYPPLRSTELLTAAGLLIQQVKNYNYEDGKADGVGGSVEFFETIDQLALAFSSRVSEYLMGDIDISSALGHSTAANTIRSRSCENLLPGDFDSILKDRENKSKDAISPEEIDDGLMRIENGVHLAFHRAKLWSKYAKDIITYIDKRSALESEYSKSLVKLAQHMRPIFKEDSFLPFQSVYCAALDKDIENANICQVTSSYIQEQKFIEPLSARRTEHEKQRKQLKELWQRELKKTQEAVVNLRKSRSQYIQRNQEYEKAKDSVFKAESNDGNDGSAKMEKKKRTEEDALQKVVDAEAYYKNCVAFANDRHDSLEKTKAYVIKSIRELMLQCDQTLKAVTVCYFQMKQTVAAPAPVQFQTLCECSRVYEPGSQFMEYVKRLPLPSQDVNPHDSFNASPYSFEPYTPELRLNDRERKSNDSCDTGDSSNNAETRETSLNLQSNVKSWSPPVTTVLGSDSDSVGSSQSNKSRDTSPSASPQVPVRKVVSHTSSGDELDNDMDAILENGYGSRGTLQSKAATTHTFRKLRTLGKCRECDSYVYFQGVECNQCGLACHKKCLESLAIQCGHKRLPRKMNTFGVDLLTHIQDTRVEVPHLVSRCISEIEKRGLHVKGIYRVSCVKSRVEKLCQSFENGANLVDLSEVHPSVIANVLKLYLRELPEPLLTFRLYQELIRIAKEWQAKVGDEDCEFRLLHELKDSIRKLPSAHKATLAMLMNHLNLVSETEDNNMPPSNLGIVFGPTLLRTSDGATLTSLVETVHQAKVVEILIQHPEIIDGVVLKTDAGVQSSEREMTNEKKSSLSDIVSKSLDELNSETETSCRTAKETFSKQISNGSTENNTSFVVVQDESVGESATVSNTGQMEEQTSEIEWIDNTQEKVVEKTPDIKSVKSELFLAKPKSMQSVPSVGVATQTELSFLRTLATASPVPMPRKHGGSVHHKITTSAVNPKVAHSSSLSYIGGGGKRSSSSGDVGDKVVLHVAAPDNSTELTNTQDKAENVELRTPINLNIQTHADQTDSGFEDTKHSPDGISVSYVSMYLSEDPYKKYRLGPTSSLLVGGNKSLGSPKGVNRSNSVAGSSEVKITSNSTTSPTLLLNSKDRVFIRNSSSDDKMHSDAGGGDDMDAGGGGVVDLSDEDEAVNDYILSDEQHFV